MCHYQCLTYSRVFLGLCVPLLFVSVVVILSSVTTSAKAAEARDSDLATILSATDVCGTFSNTTCVKKQLEKTYQKALVGYRLLPDGGHISMVKFIDESGNPRDMVLDEENQRLNNTNKNEYISAAWKRYFSTHGRVSPQLYDILTSSDDTAEIPVGIWLASPLITEELENIPGLPDENVWKEPQDSFLVYAGLTGVATEKFYRVPGAPALTATLTVSEIESLSSFEDIALIDWDPEPEPTWCSGSSSVWDDAVNVYSPSGDGYPVCIIEGSAPDNVTYLYSEGIYYTGFGYTIDSHPKHVCAVVRNSHPTGVNGISDNSSCYFGNWAGSGNVGVPVYYGCIWNASHIWNMSHTTSDAASRYFDYWSERWPYPLVVIGAANDPAAKVSPKGYNIFSVGGTDTANTSSRSDDRIARCPTYEYSYMNPCPSAEWCPVGDRELPMISAPGFGLSILGNSLFGTSFASPAVAGAAANLLSDNPSLAGNPPAIRAILMASASNDVDLTFLEPENYSVDETDGAGEVDSWLAYLVGYPDFRRTPNDTTAYGLGHDYRTVSFTSSFDSNGFANNKYLVDGTTYGSPIRIVLSWNASATCSDPANANSCTASHPDGDLDLFLYDVSTNTIVASSISFDNTYEFLQYTPPSGSHEYEIRIHRSSYTESSTKYGIAWLVWPFVDNSVN